MHNMFTPKLNILHIDDSTFVLSSIKRLLSKFTSYYYQATNGTIGLELYHQYVDILDLVIIDIHLPDTDGIKIAQVYFNWSYNKAGLTVCSPTKPLWRDFSAQFLQQRRY